MKKQKLRPEFLLFFSASPPKEEAFFLCPACYSIFLCNFAGEKFRQILEITFDGFLPFRRAGSAFLLQVQGGLCGWERKLKTPYEDKELKGQEKPLSAIDQRGVFRTCLKKEAL